MGTGQGMPTPVPFLALLQHMAQTPGKLLPFGLQLIERTLTFATRCVTWKVINSTRQSIKLEKQPVDMAGQYSKGIEEDLLVGMKISKHHIKFASTLLLPTAFAHRFFRRSHKSALLNECNCRAVSVLLQACAY